MYLVVLIVSAFLAILQSQPILGEGGNIHIYLAALEGRYETNLKRHGVDEDINDVDGSDYFNAGPRFTTKLTP